MPRGLAGSRGNDDDNRAVLLEIVRLRAERAALLGYPSHAAFVTADETAGSPEAVHDLLRRLAVARRPQRAARAGGPAGDHRRRAGAVPARGARLGVLHREGAPGRVRPRPRRAAPVVRRRAGAAGRRLPRRDRAVRHHASPSAPTCPRTTRTRGSSRCTTRTARRSACSSSTCTPATRSAAARG